MGIFFFISTDLCKSVKDITIVYSMESLSLSAEDYNRNVFLNYQWNQVRLPLEFLYTIEKESNIVERIEKKWFYQE